MKLLISEDIINRIYMAYCRKCKHKRCYDCKIGNVRQMIRAATVFDVDPDNVRPKGQWVFINGEWIDYECSECKRQSNEETLYCPGCGARMLK